MTMTRKPLPWLLITFFSVISGAGAETVEHENKLQSWTEAEDVGEGQIEMIQMKSAKRNTKAQGSSSDSGEEIASEWNAMALIHEHMSEAELGILRTKLNAGLIAKSECNMNMRGVGADASLCEQGYLQVASLCCNYQMEFYIVRVITSMGMKVCHEGGVMGIVPYFTCGNFQSLRALKASIKTGSPDETPCPVFGKIGENCTEWSVACWNETLEAGFPNEGYHRRRVCTTGNDWQQGAGQGWTHQSGSPGPGRPAPTPSSGGGRPTYYGPTTTIIGGGGGSGTSTINIYNIPPTPAPRPYPVPVPEPCSCGCVATFQHMAGTNIMQALIKGSSEAEIDDKCCKECSRHDDCQFWVRQWHTDGRYQKTGAICWLRKLAGGESYNLGYRGGWRAPGKCFNAPENRGKPICLSSMQEFSGSNVKNGKIGICGKNDAALDAACHNACVNHRDCSHWFRDSDKKGVTACQLRYNPGSEYKNRPQSRGGWKQGCGKFGTCDATFQDKGGPQVARMGVYGANHGELDAACCYLCTMNPECEYWVREWGNYGNRVCYLRKVGGGYSWSWTKRGGWNSVCGIPNAPPAIATFQEMAGHMVSQERVCGMNNTQLDTQCSMMCLANSLCNFWVREKGQQGFLYCWLRKYNTKPTKSASANRRGGLRDQQTCGRAYVRNGCKASFDHLAGTQVAIEFVCGKTDEELDAHCCHLCRNTTDCQFWVRETRKATDTDERPKLCYLRKNAGAYSKHASYRGGFRQGCGGTVSTCASTFQERGGPQVEIVGVCGSSDPYYLDSACCQKCAENPDCEFWVRDTNYPLEAHSAVNTSRCYLRKIGALTSSVNVNKRGGWNKICGVPNVAKCDSQFQDQPGLQIAQLRICGQSDADLDAQCCNKCKESDFCEYWIREKGSKGYMYCWLRRRDSPNRVPTSNVNRRGGYRENAICGAAYLKNGCRSAFKEMSGAQVGLEYVCGKNDDELDAMCCEKCRNNTQCEFWVREVRPATETDITRPKICWLRKNAGSGSNNPLRAGGWRQGCSFQPKKCAASFQERSGAQVAKVGVCGADPYSKAAVDKDYIDSVCCDLCAQHPDCEFWVREIDLPTVAQGGANTTFCYLRKTGAATSAASTTKRGGWNRICGNPAAPTCRSTFQDLAGSLVDTVRVCGKNDTALDTQCCFKCKQHDFCNHWVREKRALGWATCWLRSKHPNPAVKPNANVNRRGGYKEEPKCGDAYLSNGCKATFQEMSGAQVALEYVCGKTDEELDAMCCALCRNNTDCQFWVRERRATWEEDTTRPKMCYLRKNAGSASKNAARRGGWAHGCGRQVSDCWATFQDRSGPMVAKLGVCGSYDRKYLDSFCCDLCAKNPDCEFWVRETDLPFANNTFCYLRKIGAANPTARSNKRGGFNKICGNPKLRPRRASFQNMGGGLVDTTRVCGNNSARLDTECAQKCVEHQFCEFWLRETHPTYKDEGYKYCWLYRKATSKSASTVRRGGWKIQKGCGSAYLRNPRYRYNSSFWELSGSQAALTFVCGDTDAELDAMCGAQCWENTLCEFWVRESGESGVKQCWLRYNPGGFSKNLLRRGGFKLGCASMQGRLKAASASFQDWSGPEVNKLGVCGESNEELDKACSSLCDQNIDCEFWVREYGSAHKNQKNSKFCWLRKIGAAAAKSNANSRGGIKTCQSGKYKQCASSFDNSGGAHIETNRTCGKTEEELDAGCCARCNARPDCVMWLRQAGNDGATGMGYRYCWLYRTASAYPSAHASRRGGFKVVQNPPCSAAFKDMAGAQVGHLVVHGNNDEELDAACCAQCSALEMCQFWVREYHGTNRIPGQKNCWLRRNAGVKQNNNARRGGAKMGFFIQRDETLKPGELEGGEPPLPADMTLTDAEDPETSVNQGHGGIAALEDEAETMPEGAAEAGQATKISDVKKLDEASLKQIAERQAKEKDAEDAALKSYMEDKMNVAGSTAVLNENGYLSVAKLKSNEEMEKFILRTISNLNLKVVNEGGLAGILPFYSGMQDMQTFEHLQLELEEVAHSAETGTDAWLVAA